MKDLRSFQPPPLSEGYIGFFYREMSLPLSWLLVRIGATANQVTSLWILLGVIALALIASGRYWLTIAGALLLQLVIVLDRADGDVARYRDQRTLYGKYLDLTGHTVIKTLFFFCVGLGVFAIRPEPWVLFLSITAMLGLSVGAHLRFYRAYLLVIRNLKFERRPPPRNLLQKIVRKSEHLWLTQGLYGMLLLGAVTKLMSSLLLFYAITAPLWAVTVLLRICRELRICDSDPARYQPIHDGLDAYD